MVTGGAATGLAEARVNERALVLVSGVVELDAVPAGLGKGHRCKCGADIVADSHRVVVLALGVGRDQQAAEPALEPVAFEDRGAELLGLRLGVVKDEPTTSDEVAVEVVVGIALGGDSDVALIVSARIVGVLPLAPPVLVVELLGHVPPPLGRIEGTEEDPRPLRLEGNSAVWLDGSQTSTVFLGCAKLGERQETTWDHNS